ncbi:hypothetical protein [Noviherbaspirillum malthae]|uniref:hypothetical protein n=1 Tax=Noviherbaspirillum malthae TaxID=1260987 RepID=UPI00188ED733|nr:hypothetical protein [Noviherbaspirillum malthae]
MQPKLDQAVPLLQPAIDAATTAVLSPGQQATSVTSLAIPTTLPASRAVTLGQTGKAFALGQTVKLVSRANPNNWMLGDIAAFNAAAPTMTVNVTYAQGTGTYADWDISLAAPVLTTLQNTVVPRSGAYTMQASDAGQVVRATGALTLAYAPAAQLNAKGAFYHWIKNEHSAAITLDPNGTETINGAATLTIAAGDFALVMCDGAAFYALMSIKYVPPAPEYAYFQDQKPQGTSGGNTGLGTAGTITRTLNATVANTIAGASLSANQITLPAGTYRIRASAPAILQNAHKIFIYNVTDSTTLLTGTSSYAGNGATNEARSFVSGVFTLAVQKTISVRHYLQAVTSSPGDLGQSTGNGTEVYTEVEIWKV